jgi:hypothetical protein
MQSIFSNAERVLAAVAALALFTLNDVRMFYALPRQPDPSNSQTHAVSLQLWGAAEGTYASLIDLAVRWGLVGLTVAACVWALAETLQKQPPRQTAD